MKDASDPGRRREVPDKEGSKAPDSGVQTEEKTKIRPLGSLKEPVPKSLPRNQFLKREHRQGKHEKIVAIAEAERKKSRRLRGTIPVVVGDCRILVDGVVDSGADCTIISPEFLEKHPEIAEESDRRFGKWDGKGSSVGES